MAFHWAHCRIFSSLSNPFSSEKTTSPNTLPSDTNNGTQIPTTDGATSTTQGKVDSYTSGLETMTKTGYDINKGLEQATGTTAEQKTDQVSVEKPSNNIPMHESIGIVEQSAQGGENSYFASSGHSSPTQKGSDKVTFEGQELTYEKGGFEGLKFDDEVMLGNSSYQLTNERQRDDDGESHQVFKSGDGDARYMWNDSSRRMDMIQRDS